MLVLCAALQAAWPVWLRLNGQVPDLTVSMVLCLGLVTGSASGLTAGFLGAFVWGSVSSSPLGNLFISYMGLGFLAGALRGRMFSDRVSMAIVLVGLGVVVAALVRLLLAPPPTPQAWMSVVLARAVYTAILTVPIYLLVRVLSRYYPETETM